MARYNLLLITILLIFSILNSVFAEDSWQVSGLYGGVGYRYYYNGATVSAYKPTAGGGFGFTRSWNYSATIQEWRPDVNGNWVLVSWPNSTWSECVGVQSLSVDAEGYTYGLTYVDDDRYAATWYNHGASDRVKFHYRYYATMRGTQGGGTSWETGPLWTYRWFTRQHMEDPAWGWTTQQTLTQSWDVRVDTDIGMTYDFWRITNQNIYKNSAPVTSLDPYQTGREYFSPKIIGTTGHSGWSSSPNSIVADERNYFYYTVETPSTPYTRYRLYNNWERRFWRVYPGGKTLINSYNYRISQRVIWRPNSWGVPTIWDSSYTNGQDSAPRDAGYSIGWYSPGFIDLGQTNYWTIDATVADIWDTNNQYSSSKLYVKFNGDMYRYNAYNGAYEGWMANSSYSEHGYLNSAYRFLHMATRKDNAGNYRGPYPSYDPNRSGHFQYNTGTNPLAWSRSGYKYNTLASPPEETGQNWAGQIYGTDIITKNSGATVYAYVYINNTRTYTQNPYYYQLGWRHRYRSQDSNYITHPSKANHAGTTTFGVRGPWLPPGLSGGWLGTGFRSYNHDNYNVFSGTYFSRVGIYEVQCELRYKKFQFYYPTDFITSGSSMDVDNYYDNNTVGYWWNSNRFASTLWYARSVSNTGAAGTYYDPHGQYLPTSTAHVGGGQYWHYVRSNETYPIVVVDTIPDLRDKNVFMYFNKSVGYKIPSAANPNWRAYPTGSSYPKIPEDTDITLKVYGLCRFASHFDVQDIGSVTGTNNYIREAGSVSGTQTVGGNSERMIYYSSRGNEWQSQKGNYTAAYVANQDWRLSYGQESYYNVGGLEHKGTKYALTKTSGVYVNPTGANTTLIGQRTSVNVEPSNEDWNNIICYITRYSLISKNPFANTDYFTNKWYDKWKDPETNSSWNSDSEIEILFRKGLGDIKASGGTYNFYSQRISQNNSRVSQVGGQSSFDDINYYYNKRDYYFEFDIPKIQFKVPVFYQHVGLVATYRKGYWEDKGTGYPGVNRYVLRAENPVYEPYAPYRNTWRFYTGSGAYQSLFLANPYARPGHVMAFHVEDRTEPQIMYYQATTGTYFEVDGPYSKLKDEYAKNGATVYADSDEPGYFIALDNNPWPASDNYYPAGKYPAPGANVGFFEWEIGMHEREKAIPESPYAAPVNEPLLPKWSDMITRKGWVPYDSSSFTSQNKLYCSSILKGKRAVINPDLYMSPLDYRLQTKAANMMKSAHWDRISSDRDSTELLMGPLNSPSLIRPDDIAPFALDYIHVKGNCFRCYSGMTGTANSTWCSMYIIKFKTTKIKLPYYFAKTSRTYPNASTVLKIEDKIITSEWNSYWNYLDNPGVAYHTPNAVYYTNPAIHIPTGTSDSTYINNTITPQDPNGRWGLRMRYYLKAFENDGNEFKKHNYREPVSPGPFYNVSQVRDFIEDADDPSVSGDYYEREFIDRKNPYYSSDKRDFGVYWKVNPLFYMEVNDIYPPMLAIKVINSGSYYEETEALIGTSKNREMIFGLWGNPGFNEGGSNQHIHTEHYDLGSNMLLAQKFFDVSEYPFTEVPNFTVAMCEGTYINKVNALHDGGRYIAPPSSSVVDAKVGGSLPYSANTSNPRWYNLPAIDIPSSATNTGTLSQRKNCLLIKNRSRISISLAIADNINGYAEYYTPPADTGRYRPNLNNLYDIRFNMASSNLKNQFDLFEMPSSNNQPSLPCPPIGLNWASTFYPYSISKSSPSYPTTGLPVNGINPICSLSGYGVDYSSSPNVLWGLEDLLMYYRVKYDGANIDFDKRLGNAYPNFTLVKSNKEEDSDGTATIKLKAWDRAGNRSDLYVNLKVRGVDKNSEFRILGGKKRKLRADGKPIENFEVNIK